MTYVTYPKVRELFFKHTGLDWWLHNVKPYQNICICISCAKRVLPPQLWITP